MTAALSALAVCGCGTPAHRDSTSRTIRVAYLNDINFGDLPSLLAHDRLRAEGYAVEEIHFSATDLLIEAVAAGTIDVGNASTTAAWTARTRGARVTTVMEHTANVYRLVAAAGISTCADLGDRRLAMSEAGIATVLVRRFLAEDCAGAQPRVSYIQDSQNRVAALIAGGADAAAVDLSQLLWLDEQAPGRFTVLSNFSERWPSIKTLGVHVNADFAEGHHDLVEEYVRARLAANRDMQADAALVVAEAERRLGPSPQWPSVARAYIGARTWAPDGGLTADDVARTLEFFAGETLAQASPESVADVTFLRSAVGTPRR
ncbi:MAG: ABC transporter substrate-binding protein [Vicinamibacterales bacterium]